MILFDEKNRVLQLDVSDDEIAARLAEWRAPEPRFKRGVMAKYARLVSSAAQGAVTTV
jgi:dihydroxy-acid dehydratase